MSQRYAVIIFVGLGAPQPTRCVGPFPSAAAATAWCKREGLGEAPVKEEWASVIPQAPVQLKGASDG
jgi:hypothetical protein